MESTTCSLPGKGHDFDSVRADLDGVAPRKQSCNDPFHQRFRLVPSGVLSASTKVPNAVTKQQHEWTVFFLC